MKKLLKGCAVAVGALFVLGVLGAMFGGGNQSTAGTVAAPTAAAQVSENAAQQAPQTQAAPAVAPEPTAAPAPTEAPATYGLNQDVQVGEVRWHVLEATDLGSELLSDNQFIETKKTTGKFVRVRFELENLSKDQLTFAGVNLIDADGREFTPADDVFMFVPTEELCTLEQLNANVPQTCQVIFEVPANAQQLTLIAGDLKFFGSDELKISLGL